MTKTSPWGGVCLTKFICPGHSPRDSDSVRVGRVLDVFPLATTPSGSEWEALHTWARGCEHGSGAFQLRVCNGLDPTREI